MSEITLSKGGTRERRVNLETLQIPDLWNIGQSMRLDGGDAIIECWELAHDLKTSLGETIAQRDELLAALKDIAAAVENPKSVNIEMASLPDRVSRVARAAIAQAEGEDLRGL